MLGLGEELILSAEDHSDDLISKPGRLKQARFQLWQPRGAENHAPCKFDDS